MNPQYLIYIKCNIQIIKIRNNQHIALLKDYIDIDQATFKRFVKEHLCTDEYLLTEQEVRKVEEIEQEYLSDDFIYGNNPKYSVVKKGRVEGVGELELRMDIKNDIIKSINILGDYFLVGDLNSLLRQMKDVHMDATSLSAVIPDHLDDMIRGLRKEDLINIIILQFTHYMD